MYKLRIIDALAAYHRVELKEFHRVKVAARCSLIGCPLFAHGSRECGDGRIVCVLFFRGLQGLFNTCSLVEAVLILLRGLGSVHTAGRANRVAARHALALENHNLFARISRFDCSGHAGTAAADNDDVGVDGLIRTLLLDLMHRNREGGGINAAVFERCLHRIVNGITREGCAGDGVNLVALVLENLLRELRNRDASYALGLRVA